MYKSILVIITVAASQLRRSIRIPGIASEASCGRLPLYRSMLSVENEDLVKMLSDWQLNTMLLSITSISEPPVCALLAELECSSQSYTASEIVNRIETGEWTALQVLQAYIARAAQAQAATNCLTEVMFATALIQARKLDEDFAQTGKLRGPLHGVPVSLKDQCGYN
jgi:hypothetical protein